MTHLSAMRETATTISQAAISAISFMTVVLNEVKLERQRQYMYLTPNILYWRWNRSIRSIVEQGRL